MRIYLLIAAIAGGVTWLVTPLIRHVAIHIGAVGEVRARDVHTIPTPRMGGLGMLIGFAFAMIYSSRIAFTTGLFENNNQEWVILAGAVLICLLGMADDLWDLDWMLKMAGQLLISVFVAWGGLQIISLPLGSLITASPSISVTITAILIVASINAVNFVDGLDGLAAGVVAIGGVAFAAYSYIIARNSPSYASMATLIDVAMVGICIGFILHNWASGQAVHGRLRLDAARVSHHLRVNRDDRPSGSGVDSCQRVPAGVHADPAADSGAVPASAGHVSGDRAPTQPRQSPMHPDRMHLHHRMLRIGHTVQGAVLILWGWAALIAVGSIMTLFFKVHYVLIGFVIAVVLLTVATMYPYLKRRLPEIAAENQSYASARRRARHSFDESGDGKKRRP